MRQPVRDGEPELLADLADPAPEDDHVDVDGEHEELDGGGEVVDDPRAHPAGLAVPVGGAAEQCGGRGLARVDAALRAALTGHARAIALPEATASRQPRCPQGHIGPDGSTGTCPISPAPPRAPRRRCPDRTIPAASPVPMDR